MSHVCLYYINSLCDPGRGDDDESLGRGDVDEARGMEQDLVEGRVATAAAAALASAATKAKVRLSPPNGPITGTGNEELVVNDCNSFSGVSFQLRHAPSWRSL